MPHTLDHAKRLVRGLLERNPGVVLAYRKYADPVFLTLFFEHVDGLVFDDPVVALEWAKVLPELAKKLPRSDGAEHYKSSSEQLFIAWVLLGRAYRAAGRFADAEETYSEASRLAEEAPITGELRSDLNRKMVYLRCCQGRVSERVLELAESVVESTREEGGLPLCRSLVCYGYALAEVGDSAAAIACFGEVLAEINPKDSAADERIHLAAAHNLASLIVLSRGMAETSAALAYLRQGREAVKGDRRFSGGKVGRRNVARYRLSWLEGLAYSKLGSHRKAERCYRHALSGFEALELPWEIALVGLDLGALLHLCGEWKSLENIASVTYQRFEILAGAQKQAIAALKLWLDAVQARKLEVSLIEETRAVIAAGAVTGHCCKQLKESS